ncbi:hypothetical protein RYX36_032353 [Vicia faba]
MLELMCGIVSLEELLGHYNELYKINQTNMLQVEDHLKTNYGYVSALDIEEEEVYDMKSHVSDDKLDSVVDSAFKNYEDDALYRYLMQFFISNN